MIQLKRLLRKYNIRVLIIQILLISAQFCTCTIFTYTTTFPPLIKTPTCSSTRNRGSTRSTITPLTLLPIANTPGSNSAAAASTEYVGVYLAITISIHINIVYKRVTNIAKNIQTINRQLNEFNNSLNKIKDKLAFLKRNIIALIYNAGLPDIE